MKLCDSRSEVRPRLNRGFLFLLLLIPVLSFAETPMPAAADRVERPQREDRAWWRPQPERGWLGIKLGTREQAAAASTAPEIPEAWLMVVNLPWVVEKWDGEGTLVVEVFPDTPAEKAGILAGDVILSFNGIRTSSAGVLAFVVQRAVSGHDGDLEVLRNGDMRRVLVEIGMHPEDARRIEEEKKAAAEEAARSTPSK